jgi:hypothetical protein
MVKCESHLNALGSKFLMAHGGGGQNSDPTLQVDIPVTHNTAVYVA